jgi:coenzyme F420-dependent glucose-6-phosphate dehydrogenase
VGEARLCTRPKTKPLLVGAATEKTAEWLGRWADGLLTTSRSPDAAHRTIDAFRRGGGEGKPLFLNVGLSYAKTEHAALAAAHEQWRSVAFSNETLTELRTPQEFDAAGKFVQPEDLRENIRISADLDQHVAWLEADAALGFEEIFLHNVGHNQEEFTDSFAESVLPRLRT